MFTRTTVRRPGRAWALLTALVLTTLPAWAAAQAPRTEVADPKAGVIRPGMTLDIKVGSVPPPFELDGTFTVEPSGKVPLGVGLGRVLIGGLTYEEAEEAIAKYFVQRFKAIDPQVLVTAPGTIRLAGRPGKLGLEQRLDQIEQQLRDLRSAIEALRRQQRTGKE